jgi:hypothetical protein
MSALTPAQEEVATPSTSNPTSQVNETSASANTLPLKGSFDLPAQKRGGLAQDDRVEGNQAASAQHDRVEGKQGELPQDDKDGREPEASSSKKKRKQQKKEKEEEQEKQNQKELAPDLKLFTTAGHELILPSRDHPVSIEQLVKLGEMLDETIAADSRYWRGKTARRAAIEYQLAIRGKDKRVHPVSFNQVQREVDRKAGKRNIVLKARQVGITTYVAARFFLSTMLQPGTLSVQVAHDQQSAEEIFRIVHRFLENLPAEWRHSALKTSRANVRQIIFPKLDSEYRVESAADRCAGRGLTIQNLHCSEVARWPHDVAETLAALRAAVPPDGEIFLESTPSGAGGTFYEEWQSAPETGYVQHFFPWWSEESYKRDVEVVNFTDEELELMAKHKLDGGQIAFRREMRSQFRNRYLEEYAEDAETCFLTSGNCMFDCEVLDRRLKQPQEYCDEKENGRMLYFFPPVTGKKYIIGVDPAGGGVHGDYACAQVIEVEKGTQCAELLGHYTPQELAAKVTVLGKKYNLALVAVERNNQGEAVLAYLGMESGYPHIYPEGERQGWLTDRWTRGPMLGRLEVMLANTSQLFLSHRLLQDCRSFVRGVDGKCAAAPGAHDDTVMAMAIAQAVRAECRVQVPETEKEPAVAALAA